MIIGTILLIISYLTKEKLIQISLLLISSGAIGNAIDRIYFGGVIDFIDFLYIIFIGLHLILQIFL